jgi:hypothetical protein
MKLKNKQLQRAVRTKEFARAKKDIRSFAMVRSVLES